ncbi:MAG TPA: PAS domain-containing protein [Vicinamibacterales bacterium]|jgi:PAS domain S-box-containing protein|nr:PAS domain-containing protein [Vicinamibacterales bacterium]
MHPDNRHRRALGMAGSGTDITEHSRGEEALRQAEELNRRIVDNIGDCVKILDLEGRLLYINPVGLRELEVTDAGEFLNRSIAGFFEGEVRQAAEEAVVGARRGGCGRFQYSMRTASGVAKWFDAVVTPITDANGAVVQLLAISREITERRREEAFRAAQHQVLEMIATGSPLPAVLDSVVHLVENHSSGMLCTVLLLDEDGTRVRHGAAPSFPDEYVQAINGSSIGPRSGSCGTAMYLGTRVIVTDTLTDPLWEDYRDVARRFGLRACWSTPIFSPQRKVLGSLAMYYTEPRAPSDDELRLIETAADIARIAIEQQRAYQALRHSEARVQAILRAIPDWMFLTTAEGVFLDYHVKDVSKLHVPPSAFLGRNIREALPPSVAEPLAQAFARASASDEAEKVEYTLEAEDAERFYEACIVRCDGDKILSIVRDITARKRAELEADAHRRTLAHLSRVAMLGELSGALAHELSQPLTAVLSNAQAARYLLNRHPLDFEQLRGALDDIIRNDQRAGAVIDRLRALLRKGDTALQPVDINDVARDVIELACGELMSRRVTVQSVLAPAIRPVLGDRVQLQQVVLNLVLNACDAMNHTHVTQRLLALSTAADDGFVELVVSDRGTGIPDGQLERVFEPFVTFREQGLGLGLAISRSIVTAHGGSIRAVNNADGGATFRCLLPVAPEH